MAPVRRVGVPAAARAAMCASRRSRSSVVSAAAMASPYVGTRGVGGGPLERVPVADRPGGYVELGAVVQPHRLEARGLRPGHEVALVEVEHRLRTSPVHVVDLGDQVVDGGAAQAEQVVGAVLQLEAVDGLEEGEPSAWPQHSEELRERGGFAVGVEEHRPGGDDIDGGVRDAGEVLGRRLDEAAALVAVGAPPAVVEQVLRHVAEDDPAVRAETVERTESDQSGSASDVEEDVIGFQLGPVEDAVANHARSEAYRARRVASPPSRRANNHCAHLSVVIGSR